MKKSEKKSINPASLRKKAENTLREQQTRIAELSAKGVQDLAQELGVHQIELELQVEELQRAQAELEASRNSFADLYDFAPIGYFTLDTNKMIREVNLTAAKLLDVERQFLVGKPFSVFVEKDDSGAFHAHCAAVAAERTRQTIELRLKRRDKTEFFAQLESLAGETPDGNGVVLRMAVSDITDRRKAEEALQKSELRYRLLNENMLDGYAYCKMLYDDSGRPTDFVYLSVNRAFERLTGLANVVNRKVSDVIPGIREAQPDVLEICGRVAATGRTEKIENEFKPLGGKWFSIALYSTERDHFTAVFENISERKNVAQVLGRSEEKYRLLFENMAEGFALYELLYDAQGRPADWRVLEVNEAYTRHTGLSRDAIVGRRISELFPEAIPEYLPRFAEVVANQVSIEFETYAAATGRYNHVVSFPAGPHRFANTVTDITARKQAEQLLKDSEQRYRSLFDNMINGFAYHKIIVSGQGEPVDYLFLEVNDAFERLTGLKRGDILGRRVREVLPGIENDPADWIGTYGKVALTGTEARFDQHSALIGKWFSVTAYSPLKDHFVTIFEDITERKEAEQALQQSREDMARAQEVGSIGSWRLDVRKNALVWSDENHRIFGIPKGRPLTYESFLAAVHPDDRALVDTRWKAALRGEPYDIEHRLVVEGRTVWVREKAYLEFDKDGLQIGGFGITQDITERKNNEEAFRKLNHELEQRVLQRTRFYAVLAGINEAIVRKRDQRALFDEVCAIMVKTGGFSLAWVGLVDPESRAVRPVSGSGETAYLEGLTVIAADVPEGRGPTGRAVVEGRPVINLDFETDGNMTPWRERARKHGIRSSSAFPLRQGGTVIGALTIYSGQPSFFTADEMSLLLSLVDNLAFALEAMEVERKKQETEKELRRSSAEIRDLYNNAPCGYHSVDKDGTIVQINDTELAWLGYAREEVVGRKKITDFYTPESVEKFRASYPLFVQSGTVANLEFDLVRRDGTIMHVLLNGTAQRDAAGAFLMSRSTMVDITERKESERRETMKNELVKLFAHEVSQDEYLKAAAAMIRAWSGCQHVGIRIRTSEDGMPFVAGAGYDPDFLISESAVSLSQDRCICTRVLSGTPGAGEEAHVTPNGSFYCNDSLAYLDGLPAGQRRNYRGACLPGRFASLAVVPVRHHDRIDGAIHLADERRGMAPLANVEFIEQAALIIGEALLRFGMEKDLRLNHEKLTKTNEALRNLQAHIEAVREGERAHIAREVHDQLGQALTALKMDIAWLNKKHPSRNAEVRERAAEMLQLADDAIQSVKRITSELRPSVLDDFGLQAAIEWTAQEFQKRSGVQCRVRSRPSAFTMDRTRSTVIYRVLQESLTNVARHAKAKKVVISLDLEPEQFRMTVQDDGKGISAAKAEDRSSYGLMGMRERLRFLGGDFSISGSRGKGTTVVITIPLSVADGPAAAQEQPPAGSFT